jgi:uncharacterized protein (TIGR02246 family)
MASPMSRDTSPSMPSRPTLEEDLRAIEAINQRDMQYALANDSANMMSQWTDGIVLLQSGAPILRGRSTIAEAMGGGAASVEILQYVLDIQDVTVLGDHAIQWGTYHYSLRPRAGGEAVRTSGKIMRILQRQSDGSWKIHRGINAVDPQAQ